MTSKQEKISIQQLVNALLDISTPFPPRYLHRLSDLEGAELDLVRQAWPRIHPTRKLALLEDLEELAESDTLVFFDDLARIALDDSEPGVRSRAISLLWESERLDLVPRFLQMLTTDASSEVRAAAASALGKFIYLGEIDEIPSETLHTIEDRLIDVQKSNDEPLVRRRALEALGFSSREEVPSLIQAAYETNDPDWVASALFAMGRSYDKNWETAVLNNLHHPKANIQLEAIRAAGELELESSRRILLDILEEEAQDSEIRFATIWSLSQIGGEEVRETLENILDETEDEEEAEWIENALDNLSLTETGHAMDLLNIDLTDEDLLGHVIDLSEDLQDDDDELDNDDDLVL